MKHPDSPLTGKPGRACRPPKADLGFGDPLVPHDPSDQKNGTGAVPTLGSCSWGK